MAPTTPPRPSDSKVCKDDTIISRSGSPVRPGAVSISADDKASRLDARIAHIRKGHGAPADLGPMTATNATNATNTTSVTESSLLVARYDFVSQPPGAHDGLQHLEDTVRAKMQRHDAARVTSSSDHIDTTISKAPTCSDTCDTPDLQRFEDAVRAKVQKGATGDGAVSHTTGRTDRGDTSAAQHGLQTLEDSVRIKLQGNDSGKTTAAHTVDKGLQTFENAIRAKMASGPDGGGTEIDTLDSRIAIKMTTGGSESSPKDESSCRSPSSRPISDVVPTMAPVDAGRLDLDEGISHTNALFYRYSRPNDPAASQTLDLDGKSQLSVLHSHHDRSVRHDDLEYGEYGHANENGLTVAMAVHDHEEQFLPSAVEFDPDAKPPMYRNRRFCLYATLALIAAMAGTLGATAGLLLAKNVQSVALSDRATVGIYDRVAQMVDRLLLDDPTSPYRHALDWIQDVDAMALTPDSPHFAQRYWAAYLYYSTATRKEWTNGCHPSTESSDCTFVRWSVLHLTSAAVTLDAKRWLSPHAVCLWGGVRCDDSDQIYALDFGGSNMTGTFPEGISTGFPQLQYLSLAHGELDGPLPASLATMKHLVVLELTGNLFTGTIPDSWFHSRSLQKINVGTNKLTGTISEEHAGLKDLRGMLYYENSLVGTIPTILGTLTNIAWLRLGQNQLTGKIPTELGSLHRCIDVRLHANQLQGTIPTELARLTTLVHLFLSGANLTGTIPTEFANLMNLDMVDISNNALHGSLVPLTFATEELRFLQIENNKFTGSLPVEFSGLKGLEMFYASGNDITGTVPAQVCNLVRPTDKPGSKKNLKTFQMDCAVSSNEVAAQVDCPCCTMCCKSNGKECSAVIP